LLALSRRARRLLVGNLPMGVVLTSDMLKQFLNAALVSATLHDTSFPEGEPVVNCIMCTEGRTAFIEFRTIAETTSCLALNNIELGGRQLRMERPRDYVALPDVVLPELRSGRILGNTSVAPDGKDLLSAAIAPVVPPPSANPLQTAKPLDPTATTQAIAAVDVSKATNVVSLANMVSADELANAQEMAEILEDTKIECEKHGKVVGIAAAKPAAGGAAETGLSAEAIARKVYVCFETPEAAIECAKGLHGKQFDGRQVTTNFCPMNTFTGLLQLPCYAC